MATVVSFMVSMSSYTDLWTLANGALESLLVMVEAMEVPEGSVPVSCDRGSDSVEITDGENSYLVSWHAPTSQIWVASPISGSVRFAYDSEKECWWDARGNQELFTFVKAEVCDIFGILGG